MNLSHTPVSGLTLEKIDAYNVTEGKRVVCWKHKDRDGRGVGPNYPTKAEALSDTDRGSGGYGSTGKN